MLAAHSQRARGFGRLVARPFAWPLSLSLARSLALTRSPAHPPALSPARPLARSPVLSLPHSPAALTAQTFYTDLDPAWYVHESVGEQSPLPNLVISTLRFFVLLAAFVSVSLYVSIDSNKAFRKVIMQRDPTFKHEASGTTLKVRTMALIDELGVISHVFSDKTGTLTQNIMQFRKCSINGITYGHGNTEIGLARLARLGQLPDGVPAPTQVPLPSKGASGQPADESSTAPAGPVAFDGPELFAALRGDAGVEQRDRCRDFLLLLALTHTVVVEQVRPPPSRPLFICHHAPYRSNPPPPRSPLPPAPPSPLRPLHPHTCLLRRCAALPSAAAIAEPTNTPPPPTHHSPAPPSTLA